MSGPVRLGLRANAGQFALLVGLNALVGAMVGLERSVLPLVGKQDFGLHSTSTILAFVVAFGAAKAITNLAAGELAERLGRKRLLVIGWLVALPVPLLIGLAPSWWFIVAANLLLGVNQGFAWSMTVVMKIDLAGPRRRGLALGLNEAAGYLGVALAAFVTGALAVSYAPRTIVWVGAALIATIGLLVSVFAVRDTAPQVALEQQAHGDHVPAHAGLRSAFVYASVRDPILRACSQAGLVNNLNDALAWGLAPLYLAAHGAGVREIAVVAAVYPLVWGAGQLVTGWLSDHTGRKPLIVAGMLVQAAALGLLVAGDGAFAPSLAAAALLGVGTAMVYPTLIAAVSDASPAARPGARRRCLPLLARLRLRPRRADRRDRRRRRLTQDGDPDRRSAHRCQRPPGRCDLLAAGEPRRREDSHPDAGGVMAVEVEIDVEFLKSEIKKTYASVSEEPGRDFIFPTGRAWAEDLGYPPELAGVPDTAVESFAGVANPWQLGRLAPGERVLDLGSGAGTDSLVAAQMVAEEGRVTGIDMTPEMLAKARAAAAEMGASNVEFVESEAERLPFTDAGFDVVISNGVIDLIPDKDAVFSELFRVLVPGGRIQIADVTIQNPVSAEGRRNIDLWTG